MATRFEHITTNPGILGGKPILKGTRISVQLILEWLAGGATVADIVREYPHLTEEAVREAVLFAAELARTARFAEFDVPVSHETD
jgi:uncharacterized protein (DUF433 family)